MIKLKGSRNYILVKSKKELEAAKQCDVCGYIIWEDGNVIYLWTNFFGKWHKEKYVAFGSSKDKDDETTGIKAYQAFYAYCGKDEIEKMKLILPVIPKWESYEQLHFANIEYIGQKLYEPIYEFDANSAFTYGVMQLPESFNLLKEYMKGLYELKEKSTNSITRSKYKNLQNYLIGYFSRIKEFVSVRSEIIKQSNLNIETKMVEIVKNKGKVFLSNTDSIVTDSVGSEILNRYLGNEIGQFKLVTVAEKLFYNSSNSYQINDKVKYSGIGYFARQNTDFFKERYAQQTGTLIEGFDFSLDLENNEYSRVCQVRKGEIKVLVFNKLKELTDKIYYKLGD